MTRKAELREPHLYRENTCSRCDDRFAAFCIRIISLKNILKSHYYCTIPAQKMNRRDLQLMKRKVFFQHNLQTMQLFSMAPHCVRTENEVHNSNGMEAMGLFCPSYGSWLLLRLIGTVHQAWGEKADSCSVARRMAGYSESPWHLNTWGQVKNVASSEFWAFIPLNTHSRPPIHKKNVKGMHSSFCLFV